MFKTRLVSLLGLSVAMLVGGCSGNSSSTIQSVKEEKVSGFAGAGNIAAASIQAVAISNQGQPETALNQQQQEGYVGRTTVTASTGFYQVIIADDKLGLPTVVIVSSPDGEATMRCESVSGCDGTAYLGDIKLAQGFEYRSLVTDVAANMTINVNWLTHLANAFAYTSYIDTTDDGVNNPDKARPGIYTRYTIDVANKRMSQLFGIGDITAIRPIAPSQVAEPVDLPLLLQQQGILYGALLASIHEIKPDGVEIMSFLNDIIRSFNNNQGQLLLKTSVGSKEISLDELWRGAQLVLSENINSLRSRNIQVPSVADSVLADINNARAILAKAGDGDYSNHSIPKLSASAQKEVDSIANAKWFVNDLNARLVNFDGSDPNSCTGKDSDPADCVPSFVDLEYRQHVQRYADDMKAGLETAGPDLMLAFETIRDALDYFASDLNGTSVVNNPLNNSGRVKIEAMELPENKGIKDDTNIETVVDGETKTVLSKKLILSSDAEQLFLSFKGNANTPRKPPAEGKFFLFRINIEGKLKENGRVFSFDVGGDSTGAQVKPYLEVEYANDHATPVPFAVEEPLTIKLVWPIVRAKVVGSDKNLDGTDRSYDITQLFEAELVSINDPIIENHERRYNLKRLSYRILSQGQVIGELNEDDPSKEIRDATEGILTLNSASWSFYYPQHKWPNVDDYLKFRPGFDVVTDEEGVFRYRAGSEVVTPGGASIDFLDLLLLDQSGKAVSGKRYRQYPDADHKDRFEMEECELDVSSENSPTVDSCGSKIKRLEALPAGQEKIEIEQLANKLLPEIYTIPGRGNFRPKLPITTSDTVATITKDQWFTARGRVVRIAEGLFKYTVASENIIDDGSEKNVSYIDIVLLTDKGNVSIAERNRLIPIGGSVDKFYLQRCALVADDSGNVSVARNAENKERCDNKTELAGEPKISSLATAIQKNSYTIPSRGLYQVRLPVEPVIEQNPETKKFVEVIKPLPLNESQPVTLDGVLAAPVSLGIDTLTLRLAAELYNRDKDKQEEAIGPLIADIKMKVLAEDVFDVAITFGYKYQYLVDVVPTGSDAQSFYVAYKTGVGGTGNAPEEIGSLLVYRSGVVLAGKDAAETIGLFATSKADYQLTEADTATKACGAVNRNFNVVSCDALAYIGYKGVLLGVVREERKGVYVARFINGDFVILGK